MNWWQHIPENINPNIIQIGSFQLRYYGLMYVIVFVIFYILVLYRIENEKFEFTKTLIQNYITWVILGVILGGRLGYVIFYNPKYYFSNPVKIINPFEFSNGIRFIGISGMSYHGGLIGVIIITIFFCIKNKINILKFADFIIPAFPLGYTFGRLGNFINGELYGRVTTKNWGMYFPLDSTHQLRHPSQLYEAFFEGVVLFLILWNVRRIKKFDGFLFSLYLIGYGFLRFLIEYVRAPDSHIGFIFGQFTMGQILCVIMIICGFGIIFAKKGQSHGS